MDSKLVEVWQTAAGSPFLPTVGKNTQLLFALVLLFAGLASFGIFALSKSIGFPWSPSKFVLYLETDHHFPDRSLVSVPLIGIPASLALAYALFPTPFTTVRLSDLFFLQLRHRIHVLRSWCLRLDHRARRISPS